MTFDQIIRDLKNKVYHPIYLLMGDEPYFIDKITDRIENGILDDAEKEFNQTVVYGRDTNIQDIVAMAKEFPMMANNRVVIIKEAQELFRTIDQLEGYAKQPMESTILVIAYKYKKLDKRKKVTQEIGKHGAVFTSDKIKDWKIAEWIAKFVKQEGFELDARSSALLAECLGTDLGRIASEIEKLKLVLKKGDKITPEVIQKHIGISKDYNLFELQKAIGSGDVVKATRIVQYFGHNPKNGHILAVISLLHGFFGRLMKYHFLKDKSQKSAASTLKINPFLVRDYTNYARRYPPKKIAVIVSLLREYDLRAKGVGNRSTENSELMRELVYRIMH